MPGDNYIWGVYLCQFLFRQLHIDINFTKLFRPGSNLKLGINEYNLKSLKKITLGFSCFIATIVLPLLSESVVSATHYFIDFSKSETDTFNARDIFNMLIRVIFFSPLSIIPI